ncbi:hypothetical protein NHP190003_14310 [Helicobacter sp. NHP19-003]|uniref:GmrSD restriction endonucleases N-terminal domain-containing protein n=1 Tax=Helicobacter gastrocanis TaxID=2849641 RepID=A0ABM7SBW5_9HELI|nr:hypothetical protein NHP190003_14310 [Helicobacter sp. NHP19-003]
MQTDGFCPIREDGLCPVKALEELNFKIPDYQRGYRWGEKEVQVLLKDIVRFIQKSKAEEEFYSLQPIAVQKSGGERKGNLPCHRWATTAHHDFFNHQVLRVEGFIHPPL